MMKVPSKRDCKRAVERLTKRHGVKVYNHERWWNRKKLRHAREFLKDAGFDVEDFLENRFMYLNIKGAPMILTPGDPWKGAESPEQLAHVLGVFAHEMTHHRQCMSLDGSKRWKWVNYYTQYFGESEKRAYWELRGKCAEADIWAALDVDQNKFDHDLDAHWAEVYQLNADQVRKAQNQYDRARLQHQRNKTITVMGAELLVILKGYE